MINRTWNFIRCLLAAAVAVEGSIAILIFYTPMVHAINDAYNQLNPSGFLDHSLQAMPLFIGILEFAALSWLVSLIAPKFTLPSLQSLWRRTKKDTEPNRRPHQSWETWPNMRLDA